MDRRAWRATVHRVTKSRTWLKLLSMNIHMNFSPPGSSVHRILQARILEWVAISFSRRSSQLRVQTRVSCLAGGFFTTKPPGQARLLDINVNFCLSFHYYYSFGHACGILIPWPVVKPRVQAMEAWNPNRTPREFYVSYFSECTKGSISSVQLWLDSRLLHPAELGENGDFHYFLSTVTSVECWAKVCSRFSRVILFY